MAALIANGVPGLRIRSMLQLPYATGTTLDPLTNCTELGIEPVSWCCRDAADPIVPQQELFKSLLYILYMGTILSLSCGFFLHFLEDILDFSFCHL